MASYNVAALPFQRFTEHPGGIAPGGQVGGDTAASDALNRQFAMRADAGTRFIVVDFFAYWALDDPNGNPNDDTEPRGITVMAHYTECTDPNEPGTTETHADMCYWDHQEESASDTTRDVIKRIGHDDLMAALDKMGH